MICDNCKWYQDEPDSSDRPHCLNDELSDAEYHWAMTDRYSCAGYVEEEHDSKRFD